LILQAPEFTELLDDVGHCLSLIIGNELFLLFRHRLGRGGCWFWSKQLLPPRLGGLGIPDNFIDCAFDFKKTCLGITVQRAKLSDPLNAGVGSEEETDRINFTRLSIC
jgi:hypothetical protein